MRAYGSYVKMLDSPKAGVRCFHRPGGKRYVIDPEEGEPIIFVRAGASVVPLDEKCEIVSKDGEIVRASHRFYRTAETIDPYHVVLDIP